MRIGIIPSDPSRQQYGNRYIAKHSNTLRTTHINQQFCQFIVHRFAALIGVYLLGKARRRHGRLLSRNGAVQHMNQHKA